MSQKSYDNSPTLYLIPTPIGNMDDITLRTIKILQFVDVIFSEDTRVTGQLLKSLNIKKPLIANHEHNERQNSEKLIQFLKEGKNVGLASDRGTPIISDPGYALSKIAIEAGYNVVSLPGATALIPALTSSGIEPNPFLFYGFLSSKESKRKKELENLKDFPYTLIFYEAPHRIKDTLQNISHIFGERNISISREITKKFEEVYRGTISEVLLEIEDAKGEMVLIVTGNHDEKNYDSLSIIDHVNIYLTQGYNTKEAIKKVAKDRNVKTSEIYNEYHGIKQVDL
ncbi:MAG: 16S rRNA (cytidine(1402)-2'-O)-methyltransferase [Bacilli bacterium]|nr:16S rRNA (cytidine(1402)-2'-O)-methyltransferase [Bacilli bacterium]